jgi:hypothetical protein
MIFYNLMISLQELLFRDFITVSFVVNYCVCSDDDNNGDCNHTIGIMAGVEIV